MSDLLPVVLDRQLRKLSPWLSVMSRTLVRPGREEREEFHSFCQADYVSILAVTEDGRIPLVRQYRPALERVTMELPGGLRDENDTPEETAIRELFEETGMIVTGTPILLGSLTPDSGRLENRLWCFFARVGPQSGEEWEPELGVESFLCSRNELRKWILDGQYDHALHVALIGLAVMRGVFDWDTQEPYGRV